MKDATETHSLGRRGRGNHHLRRDSTLRGIDALQRLERVTTFIRALLRATIFALFARVSLGRALK